MANKHFSTVVAILVTVILVILGGLIRFQLATDPQEDLWVDELHTAWTVAGSMGEVLPRARLGNQSPLYFWLVYGVAGDPNVGRFADLATYRVSLRAVSLVAGTLLVAAVIWLVIRWTGDWIAAALAGALVVIDTNCIYYSTEARPYALVQLLCVLQIYFFWHELSVHHPARQENAARSKTDQDPAAASGLRDWLHVGGLVLSTVLLFYTHYTTLLLFAAEAITGLVALACWGRIRWLVTPRWLVSVISVVLLCAPGLIHVFEIISKRLDWTSFISVQSYFRQLQLPLLSYGVVPFVAALLARKIPGSGSSRVEPGVLPVVVGWVVLPIVLAIGLTATHVAALSILRFTIVVTVGLLVFAGLCITRVPSRSARSAVVLVILAAALIPNEACHRIFFAQLRVGRDSPTGFRYEKWGLLVTLINSEETRYHVPVFVFPNLVEDPVMQQQLGASLREFYRFPIDGLYIVRPPGRSVHCLPLVGGDLFTDEQVSEVASMRGAWLLVRGEKDLAADIGQLLVDQLADRGIAARARHDYLPENEQLCLLSIEVGTLLMGPGTGPGIRPDPQ